MRAKKPIIIIDAYLRRRGPGALPGGDRASAITSTRGATSSRARSCSSRRNRSTPREADSRSLRDKFLQSAFLRDFRELAQSTTRGCIVLERPDLLKRGREARREGRARCAARRWRSWKAWRCGHHDTTNFYTYIASNNTRNDLAQRGHNKQGRHNLRQVGLSYVLDGDNGLSLCHHVYRGNVADGEEFSVSLARMLSMLDRTQMARDTVTLVFDKGSAALANTVQLQEAGVGWISALPWNQAPAAFRERAVEQLTAASSAQPGVRVAAEKLLVHGQEYLCVLKYSASFAGEQLHSLTTSLSKVLQALRRLALDLNKPHARWKENQIRSKIKRWLSGQFLEELIRYQLESHEGQWRLQFDFDTVAWQRLIEHRLGRTVLLTNRMDWTAEQVALGYSGQQDIERVFRGLKDGDWLGWGPMYHWTDRKIRIHAFYCMLGISLLQYLHKQAQAAWNGISMDQLLEELRQIQQFVLLYPPQGPAHAAGRTPRREVPGR